MKIVEKSDSGHTLVEFALLMPMLLIFVLCIVDFTRAIYDMEVITNLAGEGSAAASRETANEFPATVAAIMLDADVNMTNNLRRDYVSKQHFVGNVSNHSSVLFKPSPM